VPRIFACLSVANVLLLVATGVFGLLAARLNVERHVLLAVFALVTSCLVQVIAFTYLTVTGKMIGQAVHLAGLDPLILAETKRLKRSLTVCLPLVFIPMVVVAASGASLWRSGGNATAHYLAAGVALATHLWVFWREYAVIVENAGLLHRTLEAYSSVRARRSPGASSARA
jgi:hypothetical protein